MAAFPNILFAGAYDWANVCNRVARAINAYAGERVARVATKPHPFGYQEDMAVGDKVEAADFGDELAQAAARADWLISIDGNYDLLGSLLFLCKFPKHLRLATVHTGSAYRDNHDHYNEADKKMGFDRRIIGGDLFRFADMNSKRDWPFFAPPAHDAIHPADTPVLQAHETIRVAHSPTAREVKGTDQILPVLQSLERQSVIEIDLIEGVAYEECAARRAKAHIFIDQMSDVGGYGASTTEAMSVGCATFGNDFNIKPEVDLYYPPPPIVQITPTLLEQQIHKFNRNRDLLGEQRMRSLAWVEEHASQQAIAKYWLKVLA